MEFTHIVSFIFISIAFVAMPGPNVIVIISTSLSAGRNRGLQTVMGTSLAMVLQLFVAALGTSWLLSVLAQGLIWLKWIGVLYLFYMGVMALYLFFTSRGRTVESVSATSSFHRGFWVSLTNPKTILFFSAFLPQFVSANGSYLMQIFSLSLGFWIIAVVIDSAYAVMAARLRWLLSRHDIEYIKNGVSGTLYLLASGILARSNSAG